MTIAHKWQRITDLPSDPRNLSDGELDSLQRVWQAQKDQLIERTALDEFDKRLRREWAIETGIIEDVYTLDRGVTQTLIEKGINAALIPHDAGNQDGNLVARLIQDHYDALEGMFDFVAGRRQLSTSYVKELQAALLRNVDVHVVVDQFGKAFEKRLEKGQYKTAPNSPTRHDGSLHQYCPPEHVASEMDALIRMHLDHELRKIPSEVEAAWLHHRFTQIHPFADGNGRVARAISSLVFIKGGWFPLTIKREDKTRYIEALEKADEGDLRPLVSLFVEAQRNVLMQATEAAYDVRPIASAHEAVLAARDRLLQRGGLPLNEWRAAENVATQLLDHAQKRFGEVAAELRDEIGSLGKGFGFSAAGAEQIPWFPHRESAVRKAGQTPDPAGYNGIIQLDLQTGTSSVLTLSFHAIGPRFRGLIGVVPYLVTQGAETNLIEGATFQINYEEDLASATTRFSAWLDDVIVKGLNMWRLTL
jgi:prophage maintenance system killer protein